MEIESITSRHLHEDLLSEILCRLPVKSLLRFRCVSKSWLAMVDNDANFARLHLNTLKNNRDQTRVIVVDSTFQLCTVHCADTFKIISHMPSSLDNVNEWCEVVSSVDGLVLLRRYDVLKLWNPSLRQFRQVPPLPLPPMKSSSWENEAVGLGYDPLSKDYKIVTLVYDTSKRGFLELTSVGIYAIGAGSWRIIPVRCNGSSRFGQQFCLSSGVYLHGKLYFISIDANGLEEARDSIWSFDLSNEVFCRVSSLCDICDRSELNLELLLVDGGSSVAMYDYDSNSMWVLERETMKWREQGLWSTNCTQILYGKKNRGVWVCPKIYCGKRSNTSETPPFRREKHQCKILQLNLSWEKIGHIFTYVESLFPLNTV